MPDNWLDNLFDEDTPEEEQKEKPKKEEPEKTVQVYMSLRQTAGRQKMHQ